MQGFQAGDQGEPLLVGGTSALEGAAQELDVLANAEQPATRVPVGRIFFGDNDGPAWGYRQTRQLAALRHAGQQVGYKRGFA